MDICSACGSVGTLVVHKGGAVCTECGVAEAIPALEKTDLAQDRAVDAQRKTEQSTTGPSNVQRTNKDLLVHVYVYTLQNCLMAHVKKLIDMGVHASLESAVRQIWFRTLAVSRILVPGAMHWEMQKFSPLTAQHVPGIPSIETRKNELKAEDHVYHHFASYTSCLHRFLDIQSVIWVLYAALIWIQEGVTPMDLSLWIEDGTLPFLQLSSFQKKAEGRFHAYLPSLVFHVRATPRAVDIEKGASHLAEDIGLELPPINIPLLITRTVKTLQLADVIRERAIALYRYYWYGTGFDCESLQNLYLPQLIPVTCILASMKLTYGLDDAGRDIDGNVAWLNWAQERWKECISPMQKFVPSADKLLKMTSSDLRDFVEFMDKGVFADYEIRKAYKSLVPELSRLVQNWTCRDEKSADIVRKRNATGVQFCYGNRMSYDPPLYRLPCFMYWFVPSIRSTTGAYIGPADEHLPLDFTAVLSVLSAYTNAKPRHLLPCLISLERCMISTELHCTAAETGKKKPQCTTDFFTAKREESLVLRGLEEEGYTRTHARRLYLEQQLKFDKILNSNGVVDTQMESEDDLVLKAADWYERLQFARSQKSKEIPMSGVDEAVDTHCSTRGVYTEDPEFLLTAAQTARLIGQPIVSLGPRYTVLDRKTSFYDSQCINSIHYTREPLYMSDEGPIEEFDPQPALTKANEAEMANYEHRQSECPKQNEVHERMDETGS